MGVPFESIPKVIYSLWFQGRDQAPEVVKANFLRWEKLNPNYQLRILDLEDVGALLRGVNLGVQTLPPQALSDIVRARLLQANGGIWVDASLFPVRPLDDWLPHVVTEAGFFAFERPGPDRPLSSWFLVNTPGHAILVRWWMEIERFWSQPRRLINGIPANPAHVVSPNGSAASGEFPYFWFHYLFQYLLDTDAEVAACWHACTKISAGGPHHLQFLFSQPNSPTEIDIKRALNVAPVQKLDWRRSYPLEVFARLAPA